MELNGYVRQAPDERGGVAHVALIRASQVVGAEYDPVKREYVSLSVSENSGFREFGFQEGSASYREIWGGDGKPLFVHELVFRLGGMDSRSRACVEELARNSGDGFVALIKTESGKVLLAGYSGRFGTEQPLRLAVAEGVTGERVDDPSGEMLKLVCCDTAKASRFTGAIPWAAAESTV